MAFPRKNFYDEEVRGILKHFLTEDSFSPSPLEVLLKLLKDFMLRYSAAESGFRLRFSIHVKVCPETAKVDEDFLRAKHKLLRVGEAIQVRAPRRIICSFLYKLLE